MLAGKLHGVAMRRRDEVPRDRGKKEHGYGK